jgi:transposase
MVVFLGIAGFRFYDVTTFYFESKTQDDLRDFGFSKDHKVNEVQVVMGLLIDAEGLPLGYELFRGNTFDSKTMISILKKLKDQFGIKHITIVADRGLNSKLNFKEIKESGFDYIVSAKIKTMPNETQEKIINGEGYTQIKQDRDKGYYGYKTMSYTNIVKYKDNGISHILELKENLICTYSDKRANKDKKDRLRLQQKAQELIDSNNKSSMNEQKGHKKYIKKVHQNSCDTFEMQLDLEKLKADEKYDGYYAIHTSNLSLNPLDVIQNYHNLYKIEDSFRVLKSTFKTRPIYHFKPSRIEGHFILCFLSFFLERHMEYQLKNNKKTKEQITDANNINDALQSINFIKTDIENKPYYLKSNHTKLASLMFDVFKIKQPKQLNTQNDIETYI